jgi:hypothetical protein
MIRWVALVLLLARAWLLPAQANAQEQRDAEGCRADRNTENCAAARARYFQRLYGVRPFEAHRDAGDQVRRVFYVDGYGNDVVAISFERHPGRDPMLFVYLQHLAGEPAPAPLQAPVPEAVWHDLIERSALLDRRVVPEPEPAPSAEGEQTVRLCTDGWTYTAEATDPPPFEGAEPTLTRRTEGACDDGLIELFAGEVERAAFPLIPHCAGLDRSQYRNAATLFQTCAVLRGDRMAAAVAMNSAHELFRIERAEDWSLLESAFGYETVIDWNGTHSANRPAAEAARLWVNKALEAGPNGFYVEEMEGETRARVRLRGGFIRFVNVPGQTEQAMERAVAELVWEGDGRSFVIERATVGPWLPFRPPAR